jgi:hypothetical protein
MLLPWLSSVWPALVRGQHVPVPPELAGAVRQLPRPFVSAPAGQAQNYVQSLADGSRLHVHEFPGGRMVAHRDRIDPARSPLHAVAHVLTETPTGRVVAGGAALAATARALWPLLF